MLSVLCSAQSSSLSLSFVSKYQMLPAVTRWGWRPFQPPVLQERLAQKAREEGGRSHNLLDQSRCCSSWLGRTTAPSRDLHCYWESGSRSQCEAPLCFATLACFPKGPPGPRSCSRHEAQQPQLYTKVSGLNFQAETQQGKPVSH